MQNQFIHISVSEEKMTNLRGRQSVLVTFRLPERSILALSLLAAQLDIKQKSLFDIKLSEDIEVLKARVLIEQRSGEKSTWELQKPM